MKVTIATIGIHSWYPRGVARMITRFSEIQPGFEKVMAWINTFPPGAPEHVIVDGYDYSAYCAKPFALKAAMNSGAEVAILMDAAFWPVRHIGSLLQYIYKHGYYLCDNGFCVGEWCADSALPTLGITRHQSMRIPEASSYCVGLKCTDVKANKLVDEWCRLAADGVTFPGHHWAQPGDRNIGFVSHDPRVKGHRHDQTALSVIAHRLGMTRLVQRPIFTTYYGQETDRTILVNQGGM